MLYNPGVRITFHKDPPHVRMTVNDKPVTVEAVKRRLYAVGTRVVLVVKSDEVLPVMVRVGA
jgi:hypothetical protein